MTADPTPATEHVHRCASEGYPDHVPSVACLCTCGERFNATLPTPATGADQGGALTEQIASALAAHLLFAEDSDGRIYCSCDKFSPGYSTRAAHRLHVTYEVERVVAARLADERERIAQEFRRQADPSSTGIWRDACDLLDRIAREGGQQR